MRFVSRSIALALICALGGIAAGAETAADPFAVASQHYAEQRWEQACDAFDAALAEAPEHARANNARFFYGEALAQLGRWEQARKQFGELQRRDPEHRYARQALFRGGEAAYLAGQDAEAQRDLQRFRRRYPSDVLNAYVLPYLASIELHGGRAEAARALFTQALQDYPQGALRDECLLGAAQADEQLGNLDAARAAYRKLGQQAGPLAGQALLHCATVENAAGNCQTALELLDQLAATNPDAPLLDQARLARGYAYFKLARHPEAEVVLHELVDHPRLGIEARYWMGHSQIDSGQWEAAAKTLQTGAAIDPDHRLAPAMQFHAGEALVHEHQIAQARVCFDQVLSHSPDSPWADDCLLAKVRLAIEERDLPASATLCGEMQRRFPDSPLRAAAELVRGNACAEQGKTAEALDALQASLQLTEGGDDPRRQAMHRQAQAQRAICLARLGQLGEAKAAFQSMQAGELDTAVASEAACQVAEAAYSAGDVQWARELFLQLAKNAGHDDQTRRALSGLGWCHVKTSNWSEAAAVFQRLLNEYPDSPMAAEAALMRGRALEQLEQPDPALVMYQQVYERYPNSERVAEALWRAGRLHEQLQQKSQAVELYERLSREHHDFAERDAVLYRWAWLLRDAKQDGAANEVFARLRVDCPNSRFVPDVTLRLAESAAAAQKYDEAAALLAEISDLKTPPIVRQHAWFLQARMAMACEKWSDAQEPLLRLIENFPDGELLLPATYFLADVEYRQGEYEHAAERLAALCAKTKDDPQTWSALAQLRRAQALAQLKRWPEALEVAQEIRVRFPMFDQQYEADLLVGRAHAAQADFTAARAAYALVVQSPAAVKTGTAAMAQWLTGESYFHQENFAAALAEYDQIPADCPFVRWRAAALLQSAKCQESLGRLQDAGQRYEILLRLDPEGEFAAEAKRRRAAIGQRMAGASAGVK